MVADKHDQKWLLIIDNYDGLENVHSGLSANVASSVIITSRAPNSRHLGEGLEVKVDPLEDGIEILRKSGGTKVGWFDKGM